MHVLRVHSYACVREFAGAGRVEGNEKGCSCYHAQGSHVIRLRCLCQ